MLDAKAGESLANLWDDGKAAGMSEPELLLYRSNLLGADKRITNYGGGNTSAKVTEKDPLTGESVEVLWVKGSGGDVGTMKLDGFATLYMSKLQALKGLYRGVEHEDEMVGYLPHCTFDLNPRAASIDTPLHAYVPRAHVDHMHADAIIAVAASKDSRALTREVFGEEIDRVFGEKCDLLLGRKTYETFAAHWPYAQGGEDDSIAGLFNSATKYVATRSAVDLTWAGSVALHDAAADVARLKREDGPALLTQGSSDLLQTLLADDLIDEINTFTFPIVLGNGKKLFNQGAKPAAFKLADSSVTTTGVVIARYLRAGDVATGDFAMDSPTPAEIARRERMRREG